ncbi:hypothetical protein BD560DRAFT_425702 [Blakeslea trispora]|nr:hypothetical protein BD560DRAFT_425702 [Blakeslea trispora]
MHAYEHQKEMYNLDVLPTKKINTFRKLDQWIIERLYDFDIMSVGQRKQTFKTKLTPSHGILERFHLIWLLRPVSSMDVSQGQRFPLKASSQAQMPFFFLLLLEAFVAITMVIEM